PADVALGVLLKYAAPSADARPIHTRKDERHDHGTERWPVQDRMARRKDVQRVRAGRDSSKRVQRWLRTAHQRTHRGMGAPHRARVVDRVRQGSHPGDHPRNLLLTAARTIDW